MFIRIPTLKYCGCAGSVVALGAAAVTYVVPNTVVRSTVSLGFFVADAVVVVAVGAIAVDAGAVHAVPECAC